MREKERDIERLRKKKERKKRRSKRRRRAKEVVFLSTGVNICTTESVTMVVIRLSPVHSKELWSPSIVFSSPRVNELECSPTSYPVVDAMALNVRDHVVPAPGCVASTIEYRFCQIGIARPPGRFRKRVMHTRIRFFVLRSLTACARARS